MSGLDEAQKMLRKALEDELILDKLIHDTEISDATWGFHAQQALEKILKAALFKTGLEFPKTHDLVFLATLLHDKKILLPFPLEELEELTTYAVNWRYDDDAPVSLDRQQVRNMIKTFRSWTENLKKT